MSQSADPTLGKWLLRFVIWAHIAIAALWVRYVTPAMSTFAEDPSLMVTMFQYERIYLLPAKLALIAALFHFRSAAAVWILGLVLAEGLLLSGLRNILQSHGILAWLELGALAVILAVLCPILYYLHRHNMVKLL